MHIDAEDYIEHYGTLHKSGRYPWGSGGNDQPPRHREFLDYVDELRKTGMTEKQITQAMGIESIARLRAKYTIALNGARAEDISTANRLRDKGMSNVAIGLQMGRPESSIRAMLRDGEAQKASQLQVLSGLLKDSVAEKKYVQIGTGVENSLNVSSTRLAAAVAVLQEEGYQVHSVPIAQLGTGKNTKVKVLAPPNTTWGEVMKNRDQIQLIQGRVDPLSGESDLGIVPPLSVHPNRVAIKYGSEGGTQADGVIFVRPGVSDVSLGSSRYAQVRVQVGDGHYIKGMAMYKDDLPKGVDLQFNTNKENTGNKLDALKEVSEDPGNPFGAVIRQQFKRDANGDILKDANGQKQLSSAMNIVNEEGKWSAWSKTVSTQMLSKQNPNKLIKPQLDLTYSQKVEEYDRLSKLTNPTVKRMLLEKFGDETDSSAVHLEAAGINRRQGWHVILPIQSMPEGQVYAPNFRDGERVVLIRFPHAGTFEIPELVVNNNHAESKRLLGENPRDAIGIHHTVAERLSGADFDGDTVLVIPNNQGKVRTTPALDGLKNFNPRVTYKEYPGMHVMTAREKGIEMGGISNLITDMTLRQANTTEVAAAVRHSMVVIDAERHRLNYKQSAKDNGIANLKEKYQGGKNRGASTLISRATAQEPVLQRKPRPAAQGGSIDKETGRRVFVPTNAINFRTGKPSLERSTKLAETTDAHTLSSGTPVERLYADHSNKLKTLANRARRDSVNTPRAKYSPSAAKVYSPQVQSLKSKLFIAKSNAPLERQAQVVGNKAYRARLEANPHLDEGSKRKIKGQTLETARARLGAKKKQIEITPEEWEAIQAGAISDSSLQDVLRNANLETVRKLATPRLAKTMSPARTARAQRLLDSGATRAEVADALGVSLTTLDEVTSVNS